MSERMHQVIAQTNVAVVTGAAHGIGAGLARALAARGMRLALVDMDARGLQAIGDEVRGDVLLLEADATDMQALLACREQVYARFGRVDLLVNNIGLIRRAGPWDSPEDWRATLDANFTTVLAGQHLFVPGMIAGATPAAVVNLGSKEGITTPPGNAAYSVAKAGVKVLTEQLAHELRAATDGRVSAHLLVPGYTWTPMNFPGTDFARAAKPEAPWSVQQVVAHALERLLEDDFYILCPDNEVTPEMDARRIAWAADDMIRNRPALSRWHPEWQRRFASWMQGEPASA
jgi:NAD(P)-dependent dehydrogenase (short-subunit alcohol dehydrogenase family)